MKPQTKRALVVGPYRTHNFGDDLVGAILTRHLQMHGYEVVVPKLGEENCEWLGIKHEPSYQGMFESSDVVVLGGGGIMSDTSGAKPGASYLEIITRAGMSGALRGKTLYATSIGAGPWHLDKSKMLAFGVSLLAEKIGVREAESYEHLLKLGVGKGKLQLGADLALLTPQLLDFPQGNSRKLGIQFDVTNFPSVQNNPNLAEIIRTLAAYAASNENDVMLLKDGKARPGLSGAAPDAERLVYSTLEDYLPKLSGLRSIFTSHLHLAITSFSQRIPTFSLYVREKTRRFYEQINRPERAVDLETATVDDLKRLIHLAQEAEWSEQDELALQSLKAKSREILDFVR